MTTSTFCPTIAQSTITQAAITQTAITQAAIAQPTLYPGDGGAAVEELQAKLNRFYGPVLALNGIFGPDTQALVWSFQMACRVMTDGIVGPRTWNYLNELTPYVANHLVALGYGSKGSEVKYLQARLNSYFTPQLTAQHAYLNIDGDFGPKTEAQVKQLQVLLGLTPDGVVGSQTWWQLETADMAKNTMD